MAFVNNEDNYFVNIVFLFSFRSNSACGCFRFKHCPIYA